MPYWKLYYHFVWGTKDRKDLIVGEIVNDLYKVIQAKVSGIGATLYAINGLDDHIHIAVSVPPKLALAAFVGQVKGHSSHFVTHALALPFAWQNEYSVFSFGEDKLDFVCQYIQNQQLHHANQTTLASFENG
jgi:putative transposase